ncbi:hypothetical protein EYF80_021349 [Liparis tanakae]|uniref:Uncharacterized protein n=1 Tax=Liparis tanakae TaxID=230148 RepID=A0A4Z2HRQ1_9TELE|nr:hypothetical protein EYF80_021349 [Liparis tanakae]
MARYRESGVPRPQRWMALVGAGCAHGSPSLVKAHGRTRERTETAPGIPSFTQLLQTSEVLHAAPRAQREVEIERKREGRGEEEQLQGTGVKAEAEKEAGVSVLRAAEPTLLAAASLRPLAFSQRGAVATRRGSNAKSKVKEESVDGVPTWEQKCCLINIYLPGSGLFGRTLMSSNTNC